MDLSLLLATSLTVAVEIKFHSGVIAAKELIHLKRHLHLCMTLPLNNNHSRVFKLIKHVPDYKTSLFSCFPTVVSVVVVAVVVLLVATCGHNSQLMSRNFEHDSSHL